MKIPKPTEADRERFTSLVPDAPGVEVKPMFGNLGAFVNGNMFMGLFGPRSGSSCRRRSAALLAGRRRVPSAPGTADGRLRRHPSRLAR